MRNFATGAIPRVFVNGLFGNVVRCIATRAQPADVSMFAQIDVIDAVNTILPGFFASGTVEIRTAERLRNVYRTSAVL